MLAPVYRTIRTPAVAAIVGDRIYSSGMAPQGVVTPYITWFTVTDDPYVNLSTAPRADHGTIQIDCYAGPSDDQERVAINLARAVRDALDAARVVNRLIINHREPGTMLFRIGHQADFIRNR